VLPELPELPLHPLPELCEPVDPVLWLPDPPVLVLVLVLGPPLDPLPELLLELTVLPGPALPTVLEVLELLVLLELVPPVVLVALDVLEVLLELLEPTAIRRQQHQRALSFLAAKRVNAFAFGFTFELDSRSRRRDQRGDARGWQSGREDIA
jgi:hypothetical protein